MTTSPGAPAARVLVADDDTALRTLFATTLRKAGFQVQEAANGDEALQATETSCPDLLLADLVMPGLSGDQLARRVRDRCPRAVLVFMSGYTAEQLHALDIRQVVFLPKPIAPRELVEVVSRLVGGGEENRVRS